MTARSLPWARAMARTFPWERYRTFVDVGTAEGALPVQVALVNPHITGIGFDLPALQPAFEAYVASFGLADRLRFVPGSFLTDVLPSADVLVLAGVLHGWGDDQKRILLRSAYDALPRDGVLIVREIFIDEERRQAPALLFSLHMLLDTDAGRAFTANELRAWMEDTDFRGIRFTPLVGSTAMMVGVKTSSDEPAGSDSHLG
jgi:O-methyltransferase domain